MNQHQADPAKTSSDSEKQQQQQPHSSDYAPYPKLDPNDVAPPPENWSSVSIGQRSNDGPGPGPASINTSAATTMPSESNPYVSPSPVPASSTKSERRERLFILNDISYWEALICFFSFFRCFSPLNGRYVGLGEGCFGKFRKKGGRGDQESGGSCWKYVAAL